MWPPRPVAAQGVMNIKGCNKTHTPLYSLLGSNSLSLQPAIKIHTRKELGDPAPPMPNRSALFWAAAVDYAGAFVYFELKLIGNFEERAANCSANHSNSSHVTILK